MGVQLAVYQQEQGSLSHGFERKQVRKKIEEQISFILGSMTKTVFANTLEEAEEKERARIKWEYPHLSLILPWV